MERTMPKLVILSRTFAKSTDEPLTMLKAHHIECELQRNNMPEDEERIALMIGDADAVIVGSDRIGKTVMDRCPNLKIISKHGVGLDAIDVEEAHRRGIVVTLTEFANYESVADLTWLLMLAASRNLMGRAMNLGNALARWNDTALANETCEKTIGLIGYGKIGRAVAQRAVGFRNKVLVFDPLVEDVAIPGLDIVKVDLKELAAKSDIISLHAPLNDQTRGMVDEALIQRMKPGVILINTSRADLIDEAALYRALKSGKVKAAGLDVFSEEPPLKNPLLALKNVIATPHIGAHSQEANYRMGMMAAKNVIRVLLKEDVESGYKEDR